MTDPACESDSLQDLVAQLSDVLRFIFDQPQGDIVVLVGDDEVNRTLAAQLEAAPSSPLARGVMEEVLSGRTRIRRINETLHVVV